MDDQHQVIELQRAREFRFFTPDDVRKLELPGNLAVSKPSPYTHNIIAYMECTSDEQRIYSLGVSRIEAAAQGADEAAKEMQYRLSVHTLLQPIDHLATRVYSQNRGVAILEYLSWSSYYYNDGETDGMENIEYVVKVIAEQGKDFLLDVVGSKEEGLKQIFSSATAFSPAATSPNSLGRQAWMNR
ncbi:MAG: hypothetical protein P8011_12410 [Acidihalobacter sp.]